jgi:hypothetical protein
MQEAFSLRDKGTVDEFDLSGQILIAMLCC